MGANSSETLPKSCKCHNPGGWLISKTCDITDRYMIAKNILNLPVLTHTGCLHCKIYCENSSLFFHSNMWYSKKWFAEWQRFASHGFRNTDPEHNDLVLYKFSDIKTSFQFFLKCQMTDNQHHTKKKTYRSQSPSSCTYPKPRWQINDQEQYMIQLWPSLLDQ